LNRIDTFEGAVDGAAAKMDDYDATIGGGITDPSERDEIELKTTKTAPQN
jgi:hypothetical protein